MFTLKKSTSRRFFQLSFEGFKPMGKSGVGQFFNSWKGYLKTLFLYLVKRLVGFVLLVVSLVILLFQLPNIIKSFIIAKLIWSRGRLGKPIVTTIVMGAAFLVFAFGELFSSSTLVVNPPVDADYLVSTNDIIPKKEIALTTLPEARKRSEPFKYNVALGDSLYSIGEKFKISVDALEYVNGLTDSSILVIGQELTIPPVAGLVHTVEAGESLTSIAAKFDVPSQAIADFNYILDPSTLKPGTELVIPGGKVPVVVPIVVAIVPGLESRGASPEATSDKSLCVWPTTVRFISQYFSWYHNGLDVATASSGGMPPILACRSGIVIRAGWDPWGLGLHVRIDHGNGYTTIYGHMSRLDVSYGEKVNRGEIIGIMGSTGNSTGPHVHYMVEYNGVAQNPLNFVQ